MQIFESKTKTSSRLAKSPHSMHTQISPEDGKRLRARGKCHSVRRRTRMQDDLHMPAAVSARAGLGRRTAQVQRRLRGWGTQRRCRTG